MEAGGRFIDSLQLLSPAIDAANNATCKATDQRGWYRPLDGNRDGIATCDIGAYEVGTAFFLPVLRIP